MANYTLNAGEIAAHDKTLVANTADKVTMADDWDRIEIITDGAAKIYVRVDGTDATVAGAYTYPMPAVPAARELTIPTSGNTVVSLISAGTPVYTVTGIRK